MNELNSYPFLSFWHNIFEIKVSLNELEWVSFYHCTKIDSVIC